MATITVCHTPTITTVTVVPSTTNVWPSAVHANASALVMVVARLALTKYQKFFVCEVAK